jgi:hypothetical protein
MKPYKFTMNHKLDPENFPKWKNSSDNLQTEMDNNEIIAHCIVFSNRTTFHTSSKVYCHSVQCVGY